MNLEIVTHIEGKLYRSPYRGDLTVSAVLQALRIETVQRPKGTYAELCNKNNYANDNVSIKAMLIAKIMVDADNRDPNYRDDLGCEVCGAIRYAPDMTACARCQVQRIMKEDGTSRRMHR